MTDWLRHPWQTFRGWREDRLVHRLVYQSAETMLHVATQEFREPLTAGERQALVDTYGRWLRAAGPERLLGLVEQPVRTIQLFLSETIAMTDPLRARLARLIEQMRYKCNDTATMFWADQLAALLREPPAAALLETDATRAIAATVREQMRNGARYIHPPDSNVALFMIRPYDLNTLLSAIEAACPTVSERP
jgi:hypothetical protein